MPLLRSSARWVDLLSKKNWSKSAESHKHDGGQAVLLQVSSENHFFVHILWGGEFSFFKKLSSSPPQIVRSEASFETVCIYMQSRMSFTSSPEDSGFVSSYSYRFGIIIWMNLASARAAIKLAPLRSNVIVWSGGYDSWEPRIYLRSCKRKSSIFWSSFFHPIWWLAVRCGCNRMKFITWLILPVVICLSQRLSHACLSINFYMVKLRMAH